MKTKALEHRFWNNVDKHGPIPQHVPYLGNCWVWTGIKDGCGYGRFSAKGKYYKAHRWLLGWLGKSIPPNWKACHRCDNPPCVRPEHLFIGTQSDNMLDMAAKGRHRNTRKTKCINGHDFSLENTHKKGAKRICRACIRSAVSKYQLRQKHRLWFVRVMSGTT